FLNLSPGLPELLLPYIAAEQKVVDATQECELAVIDVDQVSCEGDFHCAHVVPQSQRIYVMTSFFAPNGMSKLVEALSQERTGGGVTRVYTDLATFELADGEVLLRELCDGLTLYSLQAELDVEILVPPGLRLFNIPPLS